MFSNLLLVIMKTCWYYIFDRLLLLREEVNLEPEPLKSHCPEQEYSWVFARKMVQCYIAVVLPGDFPTAVLCTLHVKSLNSHSKWKP